MSRGCCGLPAAGLASSSSRWGQPSWRAALLCDELGPAKPGRDAPWNRTAHTPSALHGAVHTPSSTRHALQRTQHLSHCCLQESLLHLHAPAILLFFHLLPSVATLWVLHQLQTAPALTLGPFTARSFRGSLVPITLYGVQVMPSCKRMQTGASKCGACLLAS